jgi:hypothetical protein
MPLSNRFELFVPGRAVPQGSKTAFVSKSTGRPIVVDKDQRLPRWRAKITSAAIDHQAELMHTNPPLYSLLPLTGPVAKLLRAIFDALTDAQVWKDDGQVVWCQTAKHYADATWPDGPGVHITLGVLR